MIDHSSLPPIIPLASAGAIAAAVAALRAGKLIAYPTDTLYGVGGNALSAVAVQRVILAKGREAGKGFPVLLAAPEEVGRLAREWPETAAILAARFWPGALTIVVAARPEVPQQTRSGPTVALRVPGQAALRAVIREADVPLIGTSANRSGQPPALTASAAAAALGAAVALVLNGGYAGGRPSTVVSATRTGVRLLREGAIPSSEIASALIPLDIALENLDLPS